MEHTGGFFDLFVESVCSQQAVAITRPWEGVRVLPAPRLPCALCVRIVSGGPRVLAFACSTHGRALAPFFEQAPGCVRCWVRLR